MGIGSAAGWMPSAVAADAEVMQLVTAEMAAQLRPDVRELLKRATPLAVLGRPEEALALLAPLHARYASGTLNYWETFDFHLVVGEARRRSRDWRAARTALEECLKFTDIDSYRRQKALFAIGQVYTQLKEAERAIAVYEEINGLRGGRDPQASVLIGEVHDLILGDRATAILYLEEAVRYGAANPDRSRYLLLRRAYLKTGQLDKALDTAKAMVALFDVPADVDAMEDIVATMNRRLP